MRDGPVGVGVAVAAVAVEDDAALLLAAGCGSCWTRVDLPGTPALLLVDVAPTPGCAPWLLCCWSNCAMHRGSARIGPGAMRCARSRRRNISCGSRCAAPLACAEGER